MDKQLRKSFSKIPIILCGNKSDCLDRKLEGGDIILRRMFSLSYYEISALSTQNIYKPFLHLSRHLTGKDELVFQ